MGIPWFSFSLHFLICACLVHLIWTNPRVALLFSLFLRRHIFPPSLPLRLILGWLPERIALQVRIPLRCRLYLLSLRYLILISYQHFTAASSSVFLSQRAEYVTGDGEVEALRTARITRDEPSTGRSPHSAACLAHRASYYRVVLSLYTQIHGLKVNTVIRGDRYINTQSTQAGITSLLTHNILTKPVSLSLCSFSFMFTPAVCWVS